MVMMPLIDKAPQPQLSNNAVDTTLTWTIRIEFLLGVSSSVSTMRS
ncbi:MAG: hypothetical protein HYU39_05205 [Thaumarchaeota archaeon]|nr:hypothetical protein [Nitrososphaerota archaeon]